MFFWLLSNTSSSVCLFAVVHGQGEGRGAVAPQTELSAAGEAHGKSRALMDAWKPGIFSFVGCFLLLLLCDDVSGIDCKNLIK